MKIDRDYYQKISYRHSKGQLEKEKCLEILKKDKSKKLISFTKIKHHRAITYKCLRCGKKYTKKIEEFKCYPKCHICEKESFGKKSVVLETRKITPLEEYSGVYCKIKFRCSDCNFIWKATPYAILNGNKCPKCNKRKSI